MGVKNNRDSNLLTLGQLSLRLSPPNNERLSKGDTSVKQVGGMELNVAVDAALLGLHTDVISKLPTHDIDSFMKGKVRSFRVSDDFFMYGQSSPARTGIYYYESDTYSRKPKVVYDHSNSSLFSLNIDEIPEEVYMASRCFHTTRITLALNERIRETTVEMIKRFRVVGTLVSLDVNFRGNLWTGDEARECIPRILPYVGILFCSEDTVRLTFPKTGTAKEMMENSSQESPIPIVASTQRIVHSPKHHIFGPAIYDAARGEHYEEEPHRDIEVVNRTESGDAYIPDVLYGLPSGGGDYSKVTAYGNAIAVVRNTTPGDLPSFNLEEVKTIIKAHNQTGPQSKVARQETVTKL